MENKQTNKHGRAKAAPAAILITGMLIFSLAFSDLGGDLLLNTVLMSAGMAFPETVSGTVISGGSQEMMVGPDGVDYFVVEEGFDDTIVPSLPKEDENLFGTLPDLEAAAAVIAEDKRGPIEETTILSYGSGDNYFTYGSGYIKNSTGFSSVEMAQVAAGNVNFTIELNSSEPQVLIMHTHTTESYDRFDAGFYDIDYPTRSTDTSLNVVAVGEIIAQKLNNAGINTIQAIEFHDYPSYNNSYSRSAETVKQYLEMYPSIKIVLDIHRDGLERADGTRIKPVVNIGGKKAAQIMIICGADDGTMDMPNFRENLKLAVRMQNEIQTMYPGLARPLLFDYRHYNQDLTTGSLLIEMGAHANTLAEAKYAAELVGDALVKAFTSLAS